MEIAWIVIAIAAIALLIVGIIDGNRFVVVEQQFRMPKLKKDCRFVMISDLHNKVYGQDNDKIVEAIERAKPDFVLIAGDLVTSHAHEPMDAGIQLAQELSRRYQVYYAFGNHESKIKERPQHFGGMYARLRESIRHPNMHVLEDETVYLEEYGIALTGFSLGLEYFTRFYQRKMPKDYMEQKLGKAPQGYCNVLMAHNPQYFEEYADWGADFVLSGHVHGGIMRLPVLGGVISPSYTFFPKYDGGVFTHGQSTMLLGRGMGSHTIQLRFFNPAELHVVTLTKGE